MFRHLISLFAVVDFYQGMSHTVWLILFESNFIILIFSHQNVRGVPENLYFLDKYRFLDSKKQVLACISQFFYVFCHFLCLRLFDFELKSQMKKYENLESSFDEFNFSAQGWNKPFSWRLHLAPANWLQSRTRKESKLTTEGRKESKLTSTV